MRLSCRMLRYSSRGPSNTGQQKFGEILPGLSLDSRSDREMAGSELGVNMKANIHSISHCISSQAADNKEFKQFLKKKT